MNSLHQTGGVKLRSVQGKMWLSLLSAMCKDGSTSFPHVCDFSLSAFELQSTIALSDVGVLWNYLW